MDMFLKVTFAVLLGFMLWRLWPYARDQIKNGRKGSSEEWMTTGLLLIGVVAFVAFLISIVR